MTASIDQFSKEEFAVQFKRLKRGLCAGCEMREHPMAYLLGGQSGAGKTRLQKIIMEQHGYDFIVINGDEYRSAHPRFAQIQEKYGLDAPAHTAAWAGAMVEALVDAFSEEGYNLIVEGTLRTSAVPLKTAGQLRDRGYSTHLVIMAVKPEISLISCQIRYEQMRIAGTTPRAVDPKHHETIVGEIAGNLAKLELSGLFETVALYNRSGTCLFEAEYPNEDTPASIVLHDVLFGAWSEEETVHYQNLQDQYALLQSEPISRSQTN